MQCHSKHVFTVLFQQNPMPGLWCFNIGLDKEVHHLILILFCVYVCVYRITPGLKSASTTLIGIHWCHYLRSMSNLLVFSNRSPFKILRSMVNLLVRVRLRAYVSDVDLRKWETVIDIGIGRRLENFRKDIDLRIGHRFEELKKNIGRRYRCTYFSNKIQKGKTC